MLTADDLRQIDNVFSKRIKEELKPLRENIAHIRKDVKTVVNYFDRSIWTCAAGLNGLSTT